MAYETLIVETHGRALLVRLNRPQALNALNSALLAELADAVRAFEADDSVGAMVVTGSERAFAAGADIKEMSAMGYADVVRADLFGEHALAACKKPTIAAVSGVALGGGCELAMMADFIIAADTARFGQPEIKLGVIPGIGGTQRMARAIGKAKTMDLCLTGRMMDAAEAERAGLVARIVPAASLLEEALKAAQEIAAFSPLALSAAKQVVNVAFETTLQEGIRFERAVFHGLFASEDQKEGMAAFIEKRPAAWKGR